MSTEAVRNRTKAVTRRLGWQYLKPGDVLWAVERGQGLKKGEKVVSLALIRVLSVEREPLSDLELYVDPQYELECEGFPEDTVYDFIERFCTFNRCHEDDLCNRIEFEYVDEVD